MMRHVNACGASLLRAFQLQRPERQGVVTSEEKCGVSRRPSRRRSSLWSRSRDADGTSDVHMEQPSPSERPSTVARKRSLPDRLQRLTSELQATVTVVVVHARARWMLARREIRAWTMRRCPADKTEAGADPRDSIHSQRLVGDKCDADEMDALSETIMVNGQLHRIRNEWV